MPIVACFQTGPRSERTSAIHAKLIATVTAHTVVHMRTPWYAEMGLALADRTSTRMGPGRLWDRTARDVLEVRSTFVSMVSNW